MNTEYKIMVQKIEDSYFEKEEFWYEFCLEISVLFGPILAKKSSIKKGVYSFLTLFFLICQKFLTKFGNLGFYSRWQEIWKKSEDSFWWNWIWMETTVLDVPQDSMLGPFYCWCTLMNSLFLLIIFFSCRWLCPLYQSS